MTIVAMTGFKSTESMELLKEALEVAASVEGNQEWKTKQQARVMWSTLEYSKTHPELPLDIILRMSLNDWELEYDKHINPVTKTINQ